MNNKMLFFYFIFFVIVTSHAKLDHETITRGSSFVIDYANNQFLKDGEPYRYVAGAMHYFRVPVKYWADRMWKMRAAGLNALETYIEWSSHEPEPGKYLFDDNLDIEAYFQLAQSFNFTVILRPGPYIDSERDMGGLPYWLMKVNPSMALRTNDASYMKYVEQWFSILLPKIKPYLYVNGGPIITVQVENEYGSFACDREYTGRLRDIIRQHLGNDVVLFSTDGDGDSYLQCGKIPGVYATVDFGAGSNVQSAFKPQSHFELAGPRINSEYYPGWLDLWGEPHAHVSTPSVINTLEDMLAMNASISFYVFHGGTSFGFTSGALPSNTYTPCVTSYDYDAPLNEAGDPTEKYYNIRKVLSEYLPLPDYPIIPVPSPKAAYGKVHLHHVANLWDLLVTPLTGSPTNSVFPLTFEALGQAQGYVLYCTILNGHFPDPSLLEMKGLADRAYVYIDREFVGVLSRSGSLFSMPIQASDKQKLCILVENQGRIAYSSGIKDFKGLTSNVMLNGRALVDWSHHPLPFNDTDSLGKFKGKDSGPARGTLSLFSGSFAIQRNETELEDTFLDMRGWHKGVVFLNGVNLGRYWPVQGPQVTLYVPKYFLKAWPSKNRIFILEQDKSPCIVDDLSCTIEFIDQPILNGGTPAKERSMKLFKKHI